MYVANQVNATETRKHNLAKFQCILKSEIRTECMDVCMKITHMTKMAKTYCGNETDGNQARICCL